MPGHYEINRDSTVVSIFSANIDPRESDGTLASGEDMDRLFELAGIPEENVASLNPGSGLPERIVEARFGTELWKYCVGLALLMAFIETLISRRASGEAHEG